MIEAVDIRKEFDRKEALDGLSCTIPEGSIYGLAGSNGAGKSTLLRILSGIYRPDTGEVTVDDLPLWENPETKGRIALVADEPYFPSGVSISRMALLLEAAVPGFDRRRMEELTSMLKLDAKASMNTFSKGMRRQAAIVLALCRRPKYLFLDEAFDGLDPVMRRVVRRLISEEILDRQMTAVITSHSLRELEDTCDTLALIHEGKLLLESDIGTLRTNLFKIQAAFEKPFEQSWLDGTDILNFSRTGSVVTLIGRGDSGRIVEKIRQKEPILLDVLPLSLEEVFEYEMEALGYHFS